MMPRDIVTGSLIWAAIAAMPAAAALADATTFCVSCVEPDRTYVCRVETPGNNPGPGALQFYCIVRTAKEEGHKSCAVSKQADGRCTGIEKIYTYNGPALPAQLQSSIDNEAAQSILPTAPAAPQAQTQSGPPETLVEMTSRARQRLRGDDDAPRDAAAAPQVTAVPPAPEGGETSAYARSETGSKPVAETGGETGAETGSESGSRVGNAARNVGRAARTAFGCVWSLFRDCGTEGANQP